MAILKQSTAYNRLFVMVDNVSHITGAAGKTVTVQLSKSASGIPGAWANASTPTAVEVGGAGNGLGFYYVSLSNIDTNGAGELGYNCTATGCDPTSFIDQVQTTIFTDLQITGTGRAFINSGVTKNQPLALPFTMTVNGIPTAGLTVAGQKNFGAGWSNILGTITDLTLGDYVALLTAADCNSPSAMYRFTATTADDRNIAIVFDP